MRIVRAAGFATLALATVCSASDPPVFHIDDPDRMGRPIRIVRPEFPQEARDKRLSGYVDVEGRISGLRTYQDVRYTPDSPASAVFVKALEAVVPFWELHPIFDGSSCFPSDRRVANRVSFEWSGDEPKIFVTMRPQPTSSSPRFRIETLERVELSYPRPSLMSGHQALVYAELDLMPDGTVKDVRVRSFPERGAANRPFEAEAIGKLSQWKFSTDAAPLRRACWEIIFRFGA